MIACAGGALGLISNWSLIISIITIYRRLGNNTCGIYTVGIYLNDLFSILGRSSFVGGNAIVTVGVTIDMVGDGDTWGS